MDRRKILKYGAVSTVAALTGMDVRPAQGESQAAHPGNQRASTSEQHGKTQIEKIAAITSFIPGVAPEKGGLEIYPGQDIPPLKHQVFHDAGIVIERDIPVKMRDGVVIYVDLYRPEGQEKVPVIIGWSPYGKFINGIISYARGKIKYTPGAVSKYANYEFLDPVNWCRRGHAIIAADNRGHWYSEGDGYVEGGPQESQDKYDLVEWAGTQPWSTGKVGIAGVSYFALSQYGVAALRPPHLAAINPWEGFSDPYREKYFQGGIPENQRTARWQLRNLNSTTRVEDIAAMADTHPFYDEYWASKVADLSQIEVPAYVVASWTDQGFHSRGTIRAFQEMSSKQKWLEVHGRKKWEYFLQDDSVERQMKFFDHFLKGIKNDVPTWPKVRLEVREKYYVGLFRAEKEFPLARTEYKKLYLDAVSNSLSTAPISTEAQAKYDPKDDNQAARFDRVFPETTELTGYMKLHLWLSPIGSDDMDLFVGIEKYDKSGDRVPFAFADTKEDGSVALGWLRVSHRELDLTRSTPERPVLLHQRELRLAEGVPVPVEIEIWPSSTRFLAGEKLQVVVQGGDIHKYPGDVLAQRHFTIRNKGQHVIHTGGQYDSYLLVPVIPEASSAKA
jgi:predicted acyl esterase